MKMSNPANTRKCAGCRLHADKSELIRICRSKDGKVFLDESGKADGRGLWVHTTTKCITALIKKCNGHSKLSFHIPNDVKEALNAKIKD